MAFKSLAVLARLTKKRSSISKWTLAFLMFAVAFGARLIVGPWLEPNKFLLFYPPVAAATLVCGPLQGVFVLVLSTLAAWYFLFEPSGSFAVKEPNTGALLTAFVFVSGFLTWIVALLRDAVSTLEQEAARRRHSEEQTLTAKAEAERASLAKSKFFAAASHDLRQPVQSLAMLIAAIKNRSADAAFVLKTAELMQRSLAGLNTLLNAVLDVSRLDAGAVAPELAPVDLQALLVRLEAEYRHAAGAKRLRLRLASKVDLWTTTDAVLLERIVRNLLENALRYTHRGGVLIKLREDRGFARIDVVDTGVGIPPDKKQEIFEEFSQLQNPARDVGQGLGLGLAIVARLAKLLGAGVQVSSRLGRGSRFSVLLPLGQSQSSRAALPAVEDAGGHVLVIEDNALVCAGYEMMLRNWGYEVTIARTGEEAVEVAAKQPGRFDAIVADHRLGPGLTGTAAASVIARQAKRRIPTLILTGDTGKERIAEVLRSGYRMLHKPVSAEELQRELALALQE